MSFFPPAIGKADGKLVAVKHVLKTDTFVASSVAAGGNVAVTGLSIAHEISDPDNLLIISAYFGAAANSQGFGNCGLAVAEDGALIGVGEANGNRTQVGASSQTPTSANFTVAMPSVFFVYSPGIGEKIYTVRAINVRDFAETLYVNRSELNNDAAGRSRASSALVIQEVRP